MFCQISGLVFRDFNNNGTKDNTATFNEPFVANVIVKATLTSGTSFITTTDVTGAFSFTAIQIPAASAVRVEFSGLALGDYSGFNGTSNGSNVQFVTAPNTLTNFAINAPDDYWNNTTQPNPVLALVQNQRGRSDGAYSGLTALLHIDNSTQSISPPANSSQISIDTGQIVAARRGAIFSQIGSAFGLALQQRSQRVFISAALKRGFGFGPVGPGGIYICSKGATYTSYSAAFTLQGVLPGNGGAILDFGAVTRRLAVNPLAPTAAELLDNNYLSSSEAYTLGPNSDSRDNDAFAKVGAMSYGDIEADKNTDKLYTINLFQKRLVVLDVENIATTTLNNALPATLTPLVRAYDLVSLPGWPVATGSGNNLRPYAIKVYKGMGYIGVISDAIVTQTVSDLKGYILQFDVNNIAAGFSTVVNINFDLYGLVNSGNVNMHPWANTFAEVIAGSGSTLPLGPSIYNQPIISSIEFNENGSMDIGIRDRWGDQGANFEYTPVAASVSHKQTVISGDLLHACTVGSSWILEGTAGSCDQPAANTNGTTSSNSYGDGSSYQNTGKEWYADRSGDAQAENNEGGLTKLMGTNIIASTVYDPIGQNQTVGSRYWSSQGVQWNNVNTGVKTQWARTLSEINSQDKCNALGDLEFLIDPQLLQIGNRIWNDLNYNGIQDANETTSPVVAGTIVTLKSPGLDEDYTTAADNQTWATTTDAAGNYYFDNSNVIVTDSRKPSAWVGVSGILPGYNYRIELTIPPTYSVTKTDIDLNGLNNIDNDATALGVIAIIPFNTNNITHNYDFGLVLTTTLPARLEFTAIKKGSQAKLSWKVTQEDNVSKYVLERSTDGINYFTLNSQDKNGSTTYQYTDIRPAVAVNYYRVRIVDIDGRKNFSEVRIIVFNNNGVVSVFPNPAKGNIYIQLPDSWQGKSISIQISNALGQIVINKQLENAGQITTIDIVKIPTGVYNIRVINSDGIFVNSKLLINK
jgi:hypothetical protein